LFALAFAALLVALALVFVPGCIGPFFETPPAWKRQREQTRRAAIDTIRKFEARHGDTPVEQWPELDRTTYRNAKRILADLDGK
jgi:hypothetical protein